jgi:adenosylcobinamide-phosphate guanylyltransferase
VHGLILCGGKGSRLDAPVEKPLYEIDGTPMIDRVLAAFEGSAVDAVTAVVSPHSPDTREYLDGRVSLLDGTGDGFLADLALALRRVDEPAVCTPADVPLLTDEEVDRVVSAYDGRSLTVCTPTRLKASLGMEVAHTIEADGREQATVGVDVFPPDHLDESSSVLDGHPEETYGTADVRFAVNVNRRRQAAVAEALADGE